MMLEIKNLTGGYTRNNLILRGVNLCIDKNEIVALIGQNGSGKSTLAKSLMNLIPYIEGEIIFNGGSIREKNTALISKAGISLFMQGGKIFPHLTVNENLIFASQNINREGVKKRIEEVKNYFDLFTGNENKRTKLQASYLSGGEQHQLALAMVLIQNPEFLILDEPSAGLSPVNVKSLYNTLENIKNNEKRSILLIEQNVASAVAFSDRVVLVQEGKIFKEEVSNNLNTIEKIDKFFFTSII
jgi:ABC-type branched-subunit amino acid transport system ATPase component